VRLIIKGDTFPGLSVFQCQEAKMKLRSSLSGQMLFIALILIAAVVHADAGRPLEFSLDPGAGAMDRSLSSWQGAVIGPELANGFLMVLGGVVGNVVGLYAGGLLGFLIPSSGGSGIASGPLLGVLAGSTCGSALGVYLAGSGGGRRGSFGAALGGSLLGEAAALALALVIRNGEGPFVTGFFILPPIGAALVFNSSLASRSVRAGNGLFNLAGGKLGLGVPDIHVRPVMVPGGRAKPELRFDVNVLSVEL
jgi:hypothetical protein